MIVVEPDIIIKELTDSLGFDFKEKSRKRHLIYGRAMSYKLFKDLTLLTLAEIGNYVLNKPDHAIVLNGLKTFEEIKMYEPRYFKIYTDLKTKLKYGNTIEVVEVDLIKGIIR